MAIIVIGCGGGGGGGGGTTATSATSSTSTTASATGTIDSIVTKLVAQVSPGVYMDPLNIQVGQSVQFVLVNFDLTKGTNQVLPASSFKAVKLYGNLSSNGNFTATQVSPTSSTISASFAGSAYSSPYAVTPAQPSIHGQVLDTDNRVIPFVKVKFYDASSNLVGQSTADGLGNFIASVPTTAVRFNFDASTLSTAYYYASFIYGPGTYDVLESATCSAPLPALSGTGAFALSYMPTVYATTDLSGVANTPPGPPSCSP